MYAHCSVKRLVPYSCKKIKLRTFLTGLLCTIKLEGNFHSHDFFQNASLVRIKPRGSKILFNGKRFFENLAFCKIVGSVNIIYKNTIHIIQNGINKINHG